MAFDPKEKHTDKKDEMQKKRRSFLKKTVYAAPSLIVLGQLARPTQAMASGGGGWDTSPGTLTGGA
jgi:hypothetical protein